MNMKIKKFFVEDVRCLAGRQEFEIRPLTFLVGENSTGKTTALGCFQVLASLLNYSPLDFNVDPYSMGSFNDIVTRKNPKCKEFKLGFACEDDEIQDIAIIIAEKDKSAEPVLKCISVEFKNGALYITQGNSRNTTLENKKPFAIDTEKSDIDKNIFHIVLHYGGFLGNLLGARGFLFVFHFGETGERNIETREEKSLFDFLRNKRKDFRHLDFPEPFSFAPVRSRPKRTYNPTREFEDPEGSDIPMFFMRMKFSESEQWKALHKRLNKFGQSSGLFERIEIKRHGRSMSDPFQIQVKVRGPRSNIIDVGYGVSQILPILVRILHRQRPGFFLLQQPEVHLHPRGQAELASLFANLTDQQKKHSFIIETHSDYMIDRARIEIQKGNISPEDVSLIYMEPKGSRVKVHNIGFDENANLIDAPKSYGEFFLKETNNLLGFGD